MTPELGRRTLIRGVVLAVGAGLLVAAACANPPSSDRTTFVGAPAFAPKLDEYLAGPDDYLGKRCAGLDCHGQIGRPLRIYSKNGLRAFDASLSGDVPHITGRQLVSDDERKLNYQAVIGVEPELFSQVIASGGLNPDRLLLLRKPRGFEDHKGGQIMTNEADDGYKCLVSWITQKGLDTTACAIAAAIP